MKTCIIEGCSLRHLARGWCRTHYLRNYKHGDPIKLYTEQHNHSYSSEYRSWTAMKDRCTNPKNKRYANYMGRGIKVCNEWLHSFSQFYADMGPRPSVKYTLDRIDNDGNYEPSNCRWATTKEQSNNRTSNQLVTFKGKTQNITQWCRELGIGRHLIDYRLKRGIPLDNLLSKGEIYE